MQKLKVFGPKRLKGQIKISGSKNASLPILAATLLSSNKLYLNNLPKVKDIETMINLLKSLGSKIKFEKDKLLIDNSKQKKIFASYNLVKTMRAGILVLGGLLAKFGNAKVSLPGGCAWGPRPVDFHLDGLKALGVKISIENGYVIADGSNLIGNKIHFPKISVGATGNIVMVAILAKGTTTITNAASEPEIQQLCEMLNSMGANISGIGTNTLTIKGVTSLNSISNISVIPDRIEAGTFLIAAAAVGGVVEVTNIIPEHLDSVIKCLQKANIELEVKDSSIVVRANVSNILSTNIETNEYPGFPTDLQAQWMMLMCLAKGNSTIKENIYYDRFTHIMELNRLGCNIKLEDSVAIIEGGRRLIGADVMSTDIRASAALIIAALCASGTSKISRVYHIDRGYDKIEEKLTNVGAEIFRKK